jgi:neutral ceramidase
MKITGSEANRSRPTLCVGAAVRDITPPLEVGILMSSVDRRWAKFEGVRKPLLARAVVLMGESPMGEAQRLAIVALDLLGLSGEALRGFDGFKDRIASAAGNQLAADDIVLACTHTHSAPESAALTDLHRTSEFANWTDDLVEHIGGAIAAAVETACPCEMSYGAATAEGLGIHRRFKTTQGVMMSHPEPNAEIILSRDGAVDDSVNVIAFNDKNGTPKAILINATCHPVYEMCMPVVSADYPGEVTHLLDVLYDGAVSLFLNGAAGNINPRKVSGGPDNSLAHAEALARAASEILDLATVERAPYVHLARSSCDLPSRLPDGEDVGVEVTASVAALRVGSAAIVFLPGEPFVETGLAIRQASSFALTSIVGYSEETVGYIPTDEAFAEGGYEAAFGPWSMLSPGSEIRVRRDAIALLDELTASDSCCTLASDELQAPIEAS